MTLFSDSKEIFEKSGMDAAVENYYKEVGDLQDRAYRRAQDQILDWAKTNNWTRQYKSNYTDLMVQIKRCYDIQGFDTAVKLLVTLAGIDVMLARGQVFLWRDFVPGGTKESADSDYIKNIIAGIYKEFGLKPAMEYLLINYNWSSKAAEDYVKDLCVKPDMKMINEIRVVFEIEGAEGAARILIHKYKHVRSYSDAVGYIIDWRRDYQWNDAHYSLKAIFEAFGIDSAVKYWHSFEWASNTSIEEKIDIMSMWAKHRHWEEHRA